MTGSQSVWTSSNSTIWKLEKCRFLGVYLRPTGSETMGWGPKSCIWPSPPGDSAAHSSLRNRESNTLFILVIFQIGNSDVDCWSPSGNLGDVATGFLKKCTGIVLILLSALSSVGSVTNCHKPSSLRPRPFIISQLCRSKVWAGLDAFPAQPLTHAVSARLGSHVQALGRICLHAHPGCWENPGLCGCGFGVLFSGCCRLRVVLSN